MITPYQRVGSLLHNKSYHTHMMKYTMLLLTIMIFPPASYAIEVETTLAPAAWSYKEIMPKTLGYGGSTPLTSSASGSAALFQLRLQQSFFKHWQWVLTGEALTTLGADNEQWATASNTQQNTLSIQHQEIRTDILYHWDTFPSSFSFGGWLAWQQDVQKRQSFFVNGLPAGAGSIAREIIQASWFGFAAIGRSEDGRFRLRASLGMPLTVRTTNTAIAGTVFDRKQGLRWTVDADYPLFTYTNGTSTRLTTSYHFRELGKQVQPVALWPKNQWRVFSLGIRQTW